MTSKTLSTIFTPFKIGSRTLKNRLVALPVFTGYAQPNGKVSPLLVEHYTRLAHSGVAMVVVANAAVSPDGVSSIYNLRVDRDDFIPGLARLAQAIKRGGALACLQLNHAGRLAKTAQPLLPSPFDALHPAFELNTLEAFMNFFPLARRFGLTRELLKHIVTWRRCMTNEELDRVIANFGEAADRARDAGFDMVELHGASGYLLTQFLSAYTHKTSSGTGADFNDRVTFPLAVLQEVKRRLPEDFPIGFRLLLREWVPDGIDFQEAIAWAKLLEKHGISYLSATSGTHNSLFLPPIKKVTVKPAYLRKDAAALTREVNVPTIISGRIVTPSLAEKLVRERAADLIGLGRPLVADVDWVKKADRENEIRACRNCYYCLKRVILERGLICSRWPQWLQDRTELDHKLLTRGLERGLLVAADAADLKMIRTLLQTLLPPDPEFSATVLFLKSKGYSQPYDGSEADFAEQARQIWQQKRFAAGSLDHLVKVSERAFDEIVCAEAGHGGYGLVIVGRKPTEPWRARMLHKEQGKAVGLVGSNDRQAKVLVAVDLSPASLLALRFICHFFVGKPSFDLTFVHILEGLAGPVERRWEEIRKILDWDEDFELTLIGSKSEVAADLLETIQHGGYGTIIMGKRGLSSIKSRLLGSVSATVLRGLTDQTLFLID
jgi:2,4-dienoyl-CoA reductase-like NADH-dependent reductase (Old Yellow Enzyme family)/nucleotide-binding universal stress UspA family protein